MSTNVFSLTRVPVAVGEMTDHEREVLERQISKIARDQPYPLSRILDRLSVTVRDYNLEDVVLKDLAPAGYMLAAHYPTYKLRWVFRLQGKTVRCEPPNLEENDFLALLQRGVKGLGLAEHAARFGFRFIRDLGDTARVEDVHSDGAHVFVRGYIQTNLIEHEDVKEYNPFTMLFGRLSL